jgi:hypothetical protein
LAAVAATLGFLAGLRYRSIPSVGARRRDAESLVARQGWHEEICECGVLLPASTSEEAIAQHKCSGRHKKNLMALQGASEIVVCEEVGEYRAAAQMLVNSNDYVLEVGSHVGGTTKVIASVAKHVVGLDQQADLVAQARLKLPEVQFEIGDAFDATRILALATDLKPNRWSKVFIDISGSRDLPTVVRLIDMYENTLRPDMIIVKAQALKRLLLRSRLWVDHPMNSLCRWRIWTHPNEPRR